MARNSERSIEGKRYMRNARKKRKRQQRRDKRAELRKQKIDNHLADVVNPLQKDVTVQRQLVSKYYKL